METHDRPGYPRWPVVLLLLVMVAAVGVFTYNLGVAQGVVESGRAVTAAPGTTMFYDYPRHWHWGWGPGLGFAPFLGLFWVFLMFALIRRAFWGPRWYRRHYGYYGCGPYDYDDWYYRRGPGGPGGPGGQYGQGGPQGPQPPPTQL